MQAGKKNDGVAFGCLIQYRLQIFGAWRDSPDLGMGGPNGAEEEERCQSPRRAGLAWRHTI